MSEGLPLLSTRINQARQLTQSMRGRELDADVADKIAGRLREAARLVKGKPTFQNVEKSKPLKRSRRRQLWKRDPRFFTCSRPAAVPL